MWRYLAGAIGGLALLAAGWMLFSGEARPDAVLPPAPAAAVAPRQEAEPAALPAASDRTREEKRFDRYDKDRDQSVTRDEYLASRRKAFAKLDRDGDGRLSFDEWATKTTDRFARADADRSGTLTRTEFAITAPKRRARPACACPPAPAAEE